MTIIITIHQHTVKYKNKKRRTFHYSPQCNTIIIYHIHTQYAQPPQMGATRDQHPCAK